MFDVIGIMNFENDKYFLKTKISFHLYYDEEKRVWHKFFFLCQ